MRDPGRVLLSAMLVVVLAFTSASALSYVAAAAMDGELASLEANALPSIDHLLVARTELREVAASVDAYRVSIVEGWALAGYQRERLRASRAKLQDELSTYGRLVFYPGEREVLDKLRSNLPQIEELVDRALSEADHQHAEAARVMVYQQLHPAVDAELTRLNQLIELNASWARQHGEQIRRTRSRFGGITLALDALGVVLAFAVSGLALRNMRRTMREYQRKVHEVEARGRDRDGLAHQVALELKAPVANLRLALTEAERRSPDEMLATSRRAVTTLSRVERTLDALLAFSRASGDPPEDARADLAAAVDSAIRRVRADAQRAAVDISVGALPEAEIACDREVVTDTIARLLRHALDGMGDAALRRIFVHAEPRGDRMRVEVHDTGTGAPSSGAPDAFDGTNRRSMARIGLELAAVRRAVEAHGGAIGASVDLERGRRLWIELPRAVPAVH